MIGSTNRQTEHPDVNKVTVTITPSMGVNPLGVFIIVLNRKPKIKPDTVVRSAFS
jgi:hypothetical protein